MNYQQIYDEQYTDNPVYGEGMGGPTDWDGNMRKIYRSLGRLPKNIKSIVDVGCGQGFYLRQLAGPFEIFGVEVSKVACETYLHDIPHACIDITQDPLGKTFDLAMSIGVLEHIEEADIDKALDAIRALAPNALLGIANHHDLFRGVELHVTRRPVEWWVEKLLSRYATVNAVDEENYDRYFTIECVA